jgi:predicted dehydrogenase
MNELQYYDATDKDHVQGFKKILVTDPPHPYISAWWPGGHLIGYEHAFVNQLADMMKVLGGRRKKFHPDFADGLEVQRVLEAVMISAKKKQWVKIKDVK